jgi:hypothetical protein
MATSVIPALIDALLTSARAALQQPEANPAVRVYDGFGLTEEPGDFLMIGVDDPDVETAANSANSEQEWPHVGHVTRDERGEITCAAVSWNGDADPKAARDGAYAITAELEDLLRADPTVGVAGVLWTSFGTSTELTQQQDKDGASAILIFKVAFMARI